MRVVCKDSEVSQMAQHGCLVQVKTALVGSYWHYRCVMELLPVGLEYPSFYTRMKLTSLAPVSKLLNCLPPFLCTLLFSLPEQAVMRRVFFMSRFFRCKGSLFLGPCHRSVMLQNILAHKVVLRLQYASVQSFQKIFLLINTQTERHNKTQAIIEKRIKEEKVFTFTVCTLVVSWL